jgi:hypothetical protein
MSSSCSPLELPIAAAELALTGSNPFAMTAVAGGLVAAGFLLLGGSAKRRRVGLIASTVFSVLVFSFFSPASAQVTSPECPSNPVVTVFQEESGAALTVVDVTEVTGVASSQAPTTASQIPPSPAEATSTLPGTIVTVGDVATTATTAVGGVTTEPTTSSAPLTTQTATTTQPQATTTQPEATTTSTSTTTTQPEATTTSTSTTTLPIPRPALGIPDGSPQTMVVNTLPFNQEVSASFTVTNTGTVALSNLTVGVPAGGPFSSTYVWCSQTLPAALAIGEEMTCGVERTRAFDDWSDVVDVDHIESLVLVVTGETPSGLVISSTSSAAVSYDMTFQSWLRMSASEIQPGPTAGSNQVIFTLTNFGVRTISNIAPYIGSLGFPFPFTCSLPLPATLPSGQSFTCTMVRAAGDTRRGWHLLAYAEYPDGSRAVSGDEYVWG